MDWILARTINLSKILARPKGVGLAFSIIRVLSLDIVFGVVSLNLVVGKIFGVPIPLSCSIVLGIAVWGIYTLDHLIDAHKLGKKDSSTMRHRFHQRFFHPILIALVAVTGYGVFELLFLPKPVINGGVLLGILCLGYLSIIFFFRKVYFKEGLIAILYSAGVFLSPITLINQDIDIFHLLCFLELIGLALANLTMFSLFDEENDLRNNQYSCVTMIGRLRGEVFFKFLIITMSIISLLTIVIFAEDSLITFTQFGILLMTLILASVYSYRAKLQNESLFGILADSVFYLPTFLLLV